MPHLNNALSRIPQSNLPQSVKDAATAKAQKIKSQQGDGGRAVTSGSMGAMAAGEACANCGHDESDHDEPDGGCSMCDCDGYEQPGRAAGEPELELRYVVAPLLGIEVRDTDQNPDNTWTFSGYAAVFDQPTTLYDGRFARLTEELDPAAFDRVLRTQGLATRDGCVHFNYGHDMLSVVASTAVPAGQPGWLDLQPDRRGLGFLAKVSRDDVDAIRMAVKMRDGVVNQASFAFTIEDADVVDRDVDGVLVQHRRVTSVKRLFDVCATAQGAYPQTVSQLRSYAAAIGQPELELELEGRRVSSTVVEGALAVSPRGGSAVNRRLSATQLRGIARHTRR